MYYVSKRAVIFRGAKTTARFVKLPSENGVESILDRIY